MALNIDVPLENVLTMYKTPTNTARTGRALLEDEKNPPSPSALVAIRDILGSRYDRVCPVHSKTLQTAAEVAKHASVWKECESDTPEGVRRPSGGSPKPTV